MSTAVSGGGPATGPAKGPGCSLSLQGCFPPAFCAETHLSRRLDLLRSGPSAGSRERRLGQILWPVDWKEPDSKTPS